MSNSFSYIFIFVYASYFFIFFAMITRIYSETVRITILTKTPSWTIALFFFMVVYYALKNGLNVIARVCEIYGIINIIGNVFMGVILFTQGKSINLRPVFVKEDILTYIVGVPKLVFIFLGVEILLFIPFNKKSNKNVFKYTTTIIGVTGLLYLLVSEAVISVVGADTVMLYKASLFNVVRGVDVRYLEIFRRLDGIYIIIWTFNIFCSVTLWGYGVITCINKVFKNSQGRNRVLYITLLAFIVSQIPGSTNDVENVLKYNGYLGYLTSLVIPSILLIITKVKKYDKRML
ncbi:GerAB/ArcD/ProY family transporter [Clostridium bovifaecis]|uniref:GerAB/ArcD/ProY family transporter n=1 Tax=Clostridium bovifaecis TaxID=2184719 RepID=A0A6I6EKQ2_9CLOT|nr:GerAB/ArcD/ProY family transporter [Clostridium bovifaecis]